MRFIEVSDDPEFRTALRQALREGLTELGLLGWEFKDGTLQAKGTMFPCHDEALRELFERVSEAGVDRRHRPTNAPMTRTDILRMIKRRARQAGLPSSTSCHTFRATGITAYLENGGTIENAQAIAAHESPRTTKLYDHSGDEITLDEVERIGI